MSVIEKLNKIADQENRTASNLVETLITDFVGWYEGRPSLSPYAGVENSFNKAKSDKPKQAAKEVIKPDIRPEVKINKEAASKPISPGIAPNGKPYQFEGIKWLDSSIYTAYPMNEKPTNYAMQDKWLKEKAASDAEIRRQYDEYISKNP